MKPEEYINKSVKVTKLTSAFYSQVGVVKNLTVKGNLDVEFPDERRQLFHLSTVELVSENVKPINHPTLDDITMIAQPVRVLKEGIDKGQRGSITQQDCGLFNVQLDNVVVLGLLPKNLELTRVFNPVTSALDVQPGGSHYKDMKIQPVEFIHANSIPYLEGNVIKYVCRHRNKNGLQDLEKAKHYIELLIELEYGKG